MGLAHLVSLSSRALKRAPPLALGRLANSSSHSNNRRRRGPRPLVHSGHLLSSNSSSRELMAHRLLVVLEPRRRINNSSQLVPLEHHHSAHSDRTNNNNLNSSLAHLTRQVCSALVLLPLGRASSNNNNNPLLQLRPRHLETLVRGLVRLRLKLRLHFSEEVLVPLGSPRQTPPEPVRRRHLLSDRLGSRSQRRQLAGTYLISLSPLITSPHPLISLHRSVL